MAKRQWMSREHFLDLVGATNLIPGPNSTEMAIHCGYHRAGKSGLWIAGLAFILPSVLITLVIAWFYQAYGQLPAVAPFLAGIKPVIFVIILDAVFKFGEKALKKWEMGFIGVGVVLGVHVGINDIIHSKEIITT